VKDQLAWLVATAIEGLGRYVETLIRHYAKAAIQSSPPTPILPFG
jgi:hypothetical protein